MNTKNKDPLHGVKLEILLQKLVNHYGWEELGNLIDINCFQVDPSISSSLKFLPRTPWSRPDAPPRWSPVRRSADPALLRGDRARSHCQRQQWDVRAGVGAATQELWTQELLAWRLLRIGGDPCDAFSLLG